MKTAETLKCDISVVMLMKKKMGLVRTPLYDVDLGPEAYFKAKVVALIKEYGEVTFSLMQAKAPRAHKYLSDYHRDWLREHMTPHFETADWRMYLASTREKIHEAIVHITANPPDKQISYKYIAKTAGLTRSNLISNKQIHACVEGFAESREGWQRRRFITAYRDMPAEGRPYTAIEVCRTISMVTKTYEKYHELFEEVVNELNNEVKTNRRM
jgi:hypothetical protein